MVKEKDIDAYVDKRGCSYDDAFRFFGITRNDIEYEEESDNQSPEKKDVNKFVDYSVSKSRNIGVQALKLFD